MIPGMGFIIIVIAIIVAAFVGFSNPAVVSLLIIGAGVSLLSVFLNS